MTSHSNPANSNHIGRKRYERNYKKKAVKKLAPYWLSDPMLKQLLRAIKNHDGKKISGVTLATYLFRCTKLTPSDMAEFMDEARAKK